MKIRSNYLSHLSQEKTLPKIQALPEIKPSIPMIDALDRGHG
jgi:hypothetical protein